MEVQAIQQGTCTNCDSSENNWYQEQRDFCTNGIDRLLSCDCGSRAVVRISDDGLTAKGRISHKEASWEENDE